MWFVVIFGFILGIIISVKLTHYELFEKKPMICLGIIYSVMCTIDACIGPDSCVMGAFVLCSVIGLCIGLMCQIGP